MEKIRQLIEDFEFSDQFGSHPQELYVDNSRCMESEVMETGVTEVFIAGKLFLDHSFTDESLKQLVRTELENAHTNEPAKFVCIFSAASRSMQGELLFVLIPRRMPTIQYYKAIKDTTERNTHCK